LQIFKILLTLLNIFLMHGTKLFTKPIGRILITGLHGLTNLVPQIFLFLSGRLGVLPDLVPLPFLFLLVRADFLLQTRTRTRCYLIFLRHCQGARQTQDACAHTQQN
jgi:hypothetical protein